jgi:hypothetical protein
MDNDSFSMPALSSDVPESQRHVPLDKPAPPQQPQVLVHLHCRNC